MSIEKLMNDNLGRRQPIGRMSTLTDSSSTQSEKDVNHSEKQ
jgi:hypothetical protein